MQPHWKPESLELYISRHTTTSRCHGSGFFGDFCSKKILKIRSIFQSSPIPVIRSSPIKNTLSSFAPVSEDDMLKLLLSSKTKTRDLDHIPTLLVKECGDVFKTTITNIINYSLKQGSFPISFKTVYVTLLFKNQVWTKTF